MLDLSKVLASSIRECSCTPCADRFSVYCRGHNAADNRSVGTVRLRTFSGTGTCKLARRLGSSLPTPVFDYATSHVSGSWLLRNTFLVACPLSPDAGGYTHARTCAGQRDDVNIEETACENNIE